MVRILGAVLMSAALALLGLFGIFFSAVVAEEESEQPSLETMLIREVPLPAIDARAYYVFDSETGQEIVSHNSEAELPIASVTKLFSAAAVLATTNLDNEVIINAVDVATEGEAGRLVSGQKYTIRQLLFPALLESSNDATTALHRNAESDLLLSMHAFARRHEQNEVSFSDPSGLSRYNTASARSIGLLLGALLVEYPYIIDITRLSRFVLPDIAWLNNSPFIEDPTYRGGKHGFTYDANRTAAVFFEEEFGIEASRKIGYVILGSADLRGDVSLLRKHIQESVYFE